MPDLGGVGEWCDLWGIKLNESKTETMKVSRSRTMHPQSPPLTIGETVLKESDDLDILGGTFDSKMAFGSPDKHSMIYRFLGDVFGVFSCPFWSTVPQCGARLPIHTLNCWTMSVVPVF